MKTSIYLTILVGLIFSSETDSTFVMVSQDEYISFIQDPNNNCDGLVKLVKSRSNKPKTVHLDTKPPQKHLVEECLESKGLTVTVQHNWGSGYSSGDSAGVAKMLQLLKNSK